MKRLGAFLIRIYQKFISPLKPSCCRFYPCCSQYALEAVKKFGLLKGILLAGWRLLRCNPFNLGGIDYVPERFYFVPFRGGCRVREEKKENDTMLE